MMKNTTLERTQERYALTNGRIILRDTIVTDKALIIEGNRIADIVETGSLAVSVDRLDVDGRYIAPGLIDIHIHGALNFSFNDPSTYAFTTITREHAARGVTSLLMTLATAPIPNLVACLEFSRQWMRTPNEGAQVLGVHVEGPYFSMAQRGAQDPKAIRTPDDGTANLLLEHHDVIRIMTYAPELRGALELTARLAKLGIVPAAGHSSATDQEVLAAMKLGLRHMIHLWSGQSTTVREGPWRKPGILEASLAFDELTGEIIADNRHLPPTLMRLAYKCLGADRLCAISDATNGAGMPEGSRFDMGGMGYEVHDGVGMLLDRTAFAGSTTFLNQMVPILHDAVGIGLVEAVRMASLTPARIIGAEQRKGSLEIGKDADIVIFDDDFTAWRTMVAGHWVYVKQTRTP